MMMMMMMLMTMMMMIKIHKKNYKTTLSGTTRILRKVYRF